MGLFNHTLVIEPIDGGRVTWDGQEILQDFPSEFLIEGFVRVNYNTSDEHIDGNQKNFVVKKIQARMPRLVHLTVNRWAKHIDAIIQMVQQPGGQDGHCGNFNGDPDDDTEELIDERGEAPVLPELSLLPPLDETGTAAVTVDKGISLSDCQADKRAKAEVLCKAAFAAQDMPSQQIMDACIFDVCFGGEAFAGADAAAEHASTHESALTPDV